MVAGERHYQQATFDSNRMGEFPFMPEVQSMLDHLAAKNVTAVIITNGHHKVQRDKLAACNAAALFPEPAKIIVGGEEVLAGRKEKPDASIFMKACAAAGCKPEEAIHVGDSLSTDIQVRAVVQHGLFFTRRVFNSQCLFASNYLVWFPNSWLHLFGHLSALLSGRHQRESARYGVGAGRG